jgi:Arc/MetJ-type ribon-helix-helix transcriptional regulator
MTSKLSVSLPEGDVAFLDSLIDERVTTRSAALHQVIRRQRELDAEAAYAEAMQEWEESGDAALWDQTAGDGIAE